MIDTVVVGAGAGGLTVATGLARLGKRVALVERGAVGGDCTNVGCVPSKTLLALAARAAHPADARQIATAAGAGGGQRERGRLALEGARRERDALRRDEEEMLEGLPVLELVRGSARLVPARGVPEVEVAEPGGGLRRLSARRIVLATGSSPVPVPLPGLAPGSALTYETIFELEAPPSHLAVLGAGATGCELALAFRRLGSTVTLLETGARVLPRSEPEASQVVRAALEREGVRVLTAAVARCFDALGGTLELELGGRQGGAEGGERQRVEGVERVLLACGRRPNVAGLGLEGVGVVLERGGIRTDSGHRTSIPGVYAIGDVTGTVETTHAAHAQGRRLVRRFALPLPLLPPGDYPAVTFTDPEVAQIGPTLAELRARYGEPLLFSHRVDLRATDRGRTLGLREGFVRLTAMRCTGRLLAATVVAPEAGEIIHLLTQAQRRRASLWQLSRLVIAYPALSAAIRMAADAFVFSSLPNLHRELAAYLRWRWRPPARARVRWTAPSAPWGR